MPELPEVEASRSLVEVHCAGKRVRRFHALESGGGPLDGNFDNLVFAEGLDEDRLRTATEGRTLVAARRKGKQLWLEFGARPGGRKNADDDGGPVSMLVHFGMTGAFCVKGVDAPCEYVNTKIDTKQWPPRFCKFHVVFRDGTQLAFVNSRRLGRVRLRARPLQEAPISALAPDPLWGMPTLSAFAAAFARRSAPVKSVLLDQSAAVSGVGNWVADEVLYHAGVSPKTKSRALESEQIAALHRAVSSIVKTACSVNANSKRFPTEWLFHRRWGVSKSKPPGLDSHGNKLRVDKIGGRTTIWAPRMQKGATGADSAAPPTDRKAAAAPQTKKRVKVRRKRGTETSVQASAPRQPIKKRSKRLAMAAAARVKGRCVQA